MSNRRLFVYLTLALAFFVAMGAREFYLHGPYAGFGAGIWLLPILFILSLMFGIVCGLRRPKDRKAGSGETEPRDDQKSA